ncbi:hypothetical protein TNCV_1283531 [Trichonephila clavipes]|uniref:Uncharacterized protein n=1 Tax=Trichonephila clavipes TaxID=2585209 RepID=A0A8X6SZM1_TRICX|nr:hypothetical protein TNCV_1283531 [Trichonephila clavipes]
MTMENPTEMELVNASLPSSRSSTPSLTNCERLQLVNQDLKKFSIMLSNVSHTIECIAPITSDDDPDLAALYSRQAYFDDRHQQALGELSSLPRCDTLVVEFILPHVILPLKIKPKSSLNSLRKLVLKERKAQMVSSRLPLSKPLNASN